MSSGSVLPSALKLETAAPLLLLILLIFDINGVLLGWGWEWYKVLLLSLKAVTTRWKPLVSVPQASVTYLRVTKLVRV